jgi:hypothetical protein
MLSDFKRLRQYQNKFPWMGQKVICIFLIQHVSNQKNLVHNIMVAWEIGEEKRTEWIFRPYQTSAKQAKENYQGNHCGPVHNRSHGLG